MRSENKIGDGLTDLQCEILATIQKLEPNAYGVTIFDDFDERYSLGKIYLILNELAAMGLVTLRSGNPTPERGNRPKLFAHLTEAGAEVLKVNAT